MTTEKELGKICDRLGLEKLNDMQKQMLSAAGEERDIVLLSPTGSGKTLGFALALSSILASPCGKIQAVVIAPARELVIQITDVLKKALAKYRIVAMYGGRKTTDESNELAETPDIIVGTPGRMLDNIHRGKINLTDCRVCVLDEFDKSLELGFEKEMGKIFNKMANLKRVILTSATNIDTVPDFVPLHRPITINTIVRSNDPRSRMGIFEVQSDEADKLATLQDLISSLGKESLGPSIVFVNHRESAERVYQYLKKTGCSVALYHGALDQKEREKALSQFRIGAKNILVCTDLASRGLDIPGIENVIHYHMPVNDAVFTHRNGRTARVDEKGNVYIITSPAETLPPFIDSDGTYRPNAGNINDTRTNKEAIIISAGKKEKLSKGDILGWLTKVCCIPSSSVGKIEIFDHYSLLAIDKAYAKKLMALGKNHKIKGLRQRVEVLN